MRVTRPILTVGAFIILLAGGFILLLRGCLSKYDERSALSPILYFEKDGQAVVFSIVQFAKATSYSRKGNFVSKSVSTNYFVQSNDAGTGKKISEKKVKHQSDLKYHPVKVLGASKDHAWLFMGELMAFDPFTLEKVADLHLLEGKNLSIKGKFPLEERYYKFNHSDKNIYFTALDGTNWRLDTRTLLVSETGADADITAEEREVKHLEKLVKQNREKQDSLMEQRLGARSRQYRNKEITVAEYRAITKKIFEEREQLSKERDSLDGLKSRAETRRRAAEEVRTRIEALSTNRMNFSRIKTNQDTVNGVWYGLYAEAELEKLYNRMQHEAVYGETSRRQLFSASFAQDKNGYYIIDKNNAAKKSSAAWLDGGMLLDRGTGTPVHVNSPMSFLFVYKNQVGNDGTIQVCRIALDGELLWNLDSGLKEWKDFFVTGRQLFILGADNKELSGDDANVLLGVDVENGTLFRYDYFVDK